MTKTFGAILIVLGILMLAWGGITYTQREKVIDLGPIEATREKKKHIPLSPVAGIAAVAAGVGLVVTSKKD